MIAFDQVHVYQFSLFLDEQPEPPPDGFRRLAALISRRVEDVHQLGMKLGQPETSQALMLQSSGSIAPGAMVTWKAGSGIWRVVYTPSRLDVHFDARGYDDLMDEVIPLGRVAQRLMPNLVEVPAALAQRVNRLALIVTAQATCAPGEPRPSRAVAATFFGASLVDVEARGELADSVARTNHVTSWRLQPNAPEVRVNRNESGTANVVVRNDVEETNLVWQWDVNTSSMAATHFEAAGIAGFFQRAEAWIRERADVLQRLQ